MYQVKYFIFILAITNAISLNEKAINSFYSCSCTVTTLSDTKLLLAKKIARIITKIFAFF